jgi:aminobenzoyl-glutamate utilization protein B
MLDLIQSDTLVDEAQSYFEDVQTAEETYVPFIGPDDPPAIEKNTDIMDEFRPQLEELYYDPSSYDTYLDQLGYRLSPTRTRHYPAYSLDSGRRPRCRGCRH